MSVTIPCPFCATLNRVELDKLDAGPKCGSCHRPLHLDRPVKVGSEAFDAVISKSEAPVLVDFYADWCGPCKMVAPVVDELASAKAGAVLVIKVDTDQYAGVTQRFGIRGIPTLIAFKGGKEIGRHVGIAKRPELDALLAKA